VSHIYGNVERRHPVHAPDVRINAVLEEQLHNADVVLA